MCHGPQSPQAREDYWIPMELEEIVQKCTPRVWPLEVDYVRVEENSPDSTHRQRR